MAPRVLLLAPPSISAHPEKLDNVYEIHDRSSTDLQMLDRLAAGLVQLPDSTYDFVLLLTDADGTTRESHSLLSRGVMNKVVGALKSGGIVKTHNGVFGSDSAEKTEAILAGLVDSPDGMMKPVEVESASMPLKFGKKQPNGAANGSNGTNGANGAVNSDGSVPLSLNGKRKGLETSTLTPAGVGFDMGDDLDMDVGDDDELVDEDDLITAEDMERPVIQPLDCRPKPGKRRRACKDCTCGMKEKIEAEDAAKRSNADKALNTMKLGADDLAEVDFTVQGKVGSCGNCALGDAFRCDGCPYVGLPAFKPGEEVRLLNNDIQL